MKIFSVHELKQSEEKFRKRIKKNIFKRNAVIYQLKQAIEDDEKELEKLKRKYEKC
ncbi:hypothetical protein [Halobacillus faecis]|uniref:Uncharacterized protein n=1 Tax=Halobacillus faecis TaxID=360184 RepID=A0A511WWI4_9BACI|nr:hypothetical protein [Halobacillus faecis]GEN55505.1 hypothetical protein HFA01_37670 [Halobacillus faecis]